MRRVDVVSIRAINKGVRVRVRGRAEEPAEKSAARLGPDSPAGSKVRRSGNKDPRRQSSRGSGKRAAPEAATG
jgi:hypothetical protein